MIKHIFSDMDGTLLNNHGHITSTTVNAIKDTQIPITLVSARAPMEMASTIKALELKDTQIAFNGGLIFKKDGQGWQYISEYSIAPRTAAAIIRIVSSFFPKASISYYDRSNWYTSRMDEGIEFEQNLTGQQAIVKDQAEIFEQEDFKVFKIMIITFDQQEMADIYKMLTRLELSGISIQQSGTAYLEITSTNAKKSRGIKYIVDQEKLHPSETAGFGDGHNDLPMLNMVGLPIVMDNALDEIKQAAKFVTKSNEDNGVAFALHTLTDFKNRK